MSDFIDEQTSVTNPQSASSTPPKRKGRKNIVAAVLFFLLLLVGGASAFYLMKQDQDTRQQASVSGGPIEVRLKDRNSGECKIGQPCLVDVRINTFTSNIDAVQLKIKLDHHEQDQITQLRFVEPTTVGIADDGNKSNIGIDKMNEKIKLVKNEVAAGTAREITLAWTLTDMGSPFNTSNAEQLLGSIEFVVNSKQTDTNIKFHFDPTFSKSTLYQSGKDSLKTPSSISVLVKADPYDPSVGSGSIVANSVGTELPEPTQVMLCKTNRDCPVNQECYQPPMPECPPGRMCPQVMPGSYCRNVAVNVTRAPSPPVTIVVTPTRAPSPPVTNVTPTRAPSPPATTTLVPTRVPSPPVTNITPVACAIPKCIGGTLKQVPNNQYASCPVYVCVEGSGCEFNYSNWSECRDGIQTRTVTNMNEISCKVAPILHRTCQTACFRDTDCSTNQYCNVSAGVCQQSSFSADLNGDGVINVLDLSIVVKRLFTTDSKADVNADGIVDISDYSLVLGAIINRSLK